MKKQRNNKVFRSAVRLLLGGQGGHKTPQDGHTTLQDAAKTSQDGPKMRPRRHKMAPRCAQDSTRTVNRAMLKQVGFRRASERESIEKKQRKIWFYKTPREGFMLEAPLGERSERASEASEASRAIRMETGDLPSESCSKDAFRVREGRLRKAIQHAYARQTCLVWLARVPARFHLQRASRSYANTKFLKSVPGMTFSIIFAFPKGQK